MTEQDTPFAEDMLRGADEIAAFLFGSGSERRKVYHLAAPSNLPIFKLGSMLCARKTVLMAWIEAQEQRHANDNAQPNNNVRDAGREH